jgi:hypothetical protein
MKGKNLLSVLKSDNDFAIIIALDLWKYRNDSVNRNRQEARDINIAIRDLIDALEGEKLTGARWLLLYEIAANKLLDEKAIPAFDMDDFFKKMMSLNAKFYRSVREER